ncbi:MAG: protease modulator HflC [bacterium]
MEKKTRKKITVSFLILVSLVLIFLSMFVVDETQYKIVTLFGKPTRVVSKAGLHFKSPIHTTITLDKRMLIYNPIPQEYLTRDKKNVVVDNFVCWKLIDPLDFYVTVNDVAKAQTHLDDLVYSEVSAALGRYDLSSLVSTKPGEMKITEIFQQVLDNCRKRAEKDYSIKIASVKLKQLILPQQNKQSVFDRMRAERQRIAKQYRAEGEEEALKIRAATDKETRTILSEAYRTAEITKGEGDAEAIRIYGDAYGQNVHFYKFLRTLQAYQKFMNEKTTVVLSSGSDLFKLLTEGQVKDAVRTVSSGKNRSKATQTAGAAKADNLAKK